MLLYQANQALEEARKEYETAKNEFEQAKSNFAYAEPDFIDKAIMDLDNAEKRLSETLSQLLKFRDDRRVECDEITV